MNPLEEMRNVAIICPYCKIAFFKKVTIPTNIERKLFTLFIKNHPDSEDCGPFLSFIDKQGMHRGSQKIDSMEEDSISDELSDQANEEISEMEDALRFYHLRVLRKEGRGFEYKYANVMDRAFMSSRVYSTLITFLTNHDEEDAFGILACKDHDNFQGGHLVYGKYHGIVYTVFWNDQAFLQQNSLDEIRDHANIMVNNLLDLYELREFISNDEKNLENKIQKI